MSTQNEPMSADCEVAQALIPAYCMGMTDPDETALVEQALQDCPSLQADLAQYRALADGMLLAVPMVEAPAGLSQSLADAVAGKSSPKNILPLPHAIRNWRIVAAVLAILLIGTNVFWFTRFDSQTPPPGAIEINSTGAIEQRREIDTPQNRLASLEWGTGIVDNTWIGTFSVGELPSLDESQTYQLWFIREGEDPISVGIFTVDTDGNGHIIFEINEPVGMFDVIGVSIEPAGGSDVPTGEIVLQGDI